MMKTSRVARMIATAVLALCLSAPVFAGSVDINKADAGTISSELKGVGPAKAKAIVEYRTKNGPFRSVDELRKVPGIGDKLMAKIRSSVMIGGDAAKKSAG